MAMMENRRYRVILDIRAEISILATSRDEAFKKAQKIGIYDRGEWDEIGPLYITTIDVEEEKENG